MVRLTLQSLSLPPSPCASGLSVPLMLAPLCTYRDSVAAANRAAATMSTPSREQQVVAANGSVRAGGRVRWSLSLAQIPAATHERNSLACPESERNAARRADGRGSTCALPAKAITATCPSLFFLRATPFSFRLEPALPAAPSRVPCPSSAFCGPLARIARVSPRSAHAYPAPCSEASRGGRVCVCVCVCPVCWSLRLFLAWRGCPSRRAGQRRRWERKKHEELARHEQHKEHTWSARGCAYAHGEH